MGTGIILLHSVARKIHKTISDRHPKFCEKIAHLTATFWDILWGLAQCQANLPFHRHLKFFDKIPCPTLSFSENGGHWHYVGAEKNATNQLNLSCHRLCMALLQKYQPYPRLALPLRPGTINRVRTGAIYS